MKALPFQIPKISESSVRVQIDRQPFFYDTLHQHPEIQITLIVSGTGTLFQGEYIGEFKPGDVFIIGGNVPHVLKSDSIYYKDDQLISHAISIFFDKKSLGASFFNLPELKNINSFIQQLNRGVQLENTLKIKVGEIVRETPFCEGVEVIMSLLKILQLTSQSNEVNFLSRETNESYLDENEGIRLKGVYQFTLENFSNAIRLEEVAEIASMTPSAFCRFFKLRTRKTYISFLNEIRVAEACKLLLNEDLPIAQIGYQCGFSNLSNFNRIFKNVKQEAPSAFRKKRLKFAE